MASTKSVVRQDIITKEILLFPSVNACIRSFEFKVDVSGLIKNYIKPKKIFKDRYLIEYLSKYKGITPIGASPLACNKEDDKS